MRQDVLMINPKITTSMQEEVAAQKNLVQKLEIWKNPQELML